MLEPGQRVTVDLSGLVIKGVPFSGNVKKAPGTIVQQVSPEPPVYLVELLFSFKGIRRVEVSGERIPDLGVCRGSETRSPPAEIPPKMEIT
jgi:hypothetical protein